MRKFKQSLLPQGARMCASMKEAFEMLLDCKCAEMEGKVYRQFCDEFGFDPDRLTLREMLAHAAAMKGLGGDVNALKFITETTDGKPKDTDPVENPLKQLTDNELDGLIKNEQKLLEGGKECQRKR